MAGLLDFISSPAGMGLLSAVAGGMAGARRGQPINSLGRGLVTGLQGYQGAEDQTRKNTENDLANKYRQMQMDQMQQTMDTQKDQKAWSANLSDVLTPQAAKPAAFNVGGQSFGNPQDAITSAQTMYNLPTGAMPDSLANPYQHDTKPLAYKPQDPGLDMPTSPQQTGIQDFSGGQAAPITQQAATPGGVDPQRLRQYLALPGNPDQKKYLESLMPKAPKWNVTERYNEKTGMPEKVLMDENNPSDIRPFGGTQADTIVSDNNGGQSVLRGSHSANPISINQHTVSPDAQLSANTQAIQGNLNRGVTIRGQNLVQARANDVTLNHGIAGLSTEQNNALFGPTGAVTTGKLDPNRINSRTASLYANAFLLNPTSDMSKTSADIQLSRNATFRQKAMIAETLPEIMSNMVETGKKLDFNDVRAVGKIQAFAKGQLNDPTYTEYMTQRNDALMTIAGVMRGTGMTDQAHRAETEVSDPTMSPKALDAWMAGQMKSLKPRLQINRSITGGHSGETTSGATNLPKKKVSLDDYLKSQGH